MSWGVKRERGGWVATWKRKSWGMAPLLSRAEAEAYMLRLVERHPEGGDWIFDQPRRRKDGYRYELADGSSGTIYTRSLAIAKATLRRRLKRRRLPNGTTWETAYR
jgi:hypothetical protein